MGRLIIDGNSVFEIDEECLKKRKISKDCDLKKYFKDDKNYSLSKTVITESKMDGKTNPKR